MAEFAYNNAKNASIGHMLFKLNYGYHSQVFFEDNVNFYSSSYFANKLIEELRKLIDICQQNLLHNQKLKKRAYDRNVKLQSYALREMVWLNTKYIKTNQNEKFKVKFFGPFQILYLFRKQVYKLNLFTK